MLGCSTKKLHFVFPFDTDIITIFHCKQAIARHCNDYSAKNTDFKFKTYAQANLHILSWSNAVDTVTLDIISTSHREATAY